MEFKVDIKPENTVLANHNLQKGGKVQQFIDSECIRLMAQYTPFQSNKLIQSATLGTTIGSGILKQNAPNARYDYYGKLMVSSKTGSAWARKGESKVLTDKDLVFHGGGKRGKMWFERMKSDKKKDILKGAQKLL